MSDHMMAESRQTLIFQIIALHDWHVTPREVERYRAASRRDG